MRLGSKLSVAALVSGWLLVAQAAVAAAPSAAKVAVEDEIGAIRTAFSKDLFAEVERRLDALLARDDLRPSDRIWALHGRVVLLHQLHRTCALVDAIDRYLAAAEGDPQVAVQRERARRRRAEAGVECAASRRRRVVPPPPPPPPPSPPSGRGTLVVGSGGVLLDRGRSTLTGGVVGVEASLGYLWPDGWQVDGGVLLTLHGLAVRSGLRLDVGAPWRGGVTQVRLAGQLLLAPDVEGAVRVGGGALAGVGLGVDLGAGLGLLTIVEASVWPDGLHAALDGRVGVSYAF